MGKGVTSMEDEAEGAETQGKRQEKRCNKYRHWKEQSLFQTVIWVIWTVTVRNVPFGFKKLMVSDLFHRTLRTKKAKDVSIDGTSDKKIIC